MIRCGGPGPPTTRQAPFIGKAAPVVKSGHVVFRIRTKDSVQAALAAVLLTVGTFVLFLLYSPFPFYRVIPAPALCVVPVVLVWLMWVTIVDAILRKRATSEADTDVGAPAWDERSGRASFELADGRWSSFELLELDPDRRAELFSALRACYKGQLSPAELPRRRPGEIALVILMLTLAALAVVLWAIVTIMWPE